MLTFLSNNLGSIIVGLLLTAVVLAVVVRMIRNKKAGRSSCSCGCDCSACCGCHPSEAVSQPTAK